MFLCDGICPSREKLATDKKVQLKQHLPDLLKMYNSTQSTVTGYSLHYLMFRKHSCLPVDYYYPTMRAHMHSRCVPTYVEEVRKHCKEAYAEVQLQSNSEMDQQKRYYDRAISTQQSTYWCVRSLMTGLRMRCEMMAGT